MTESFDDPWGLASPSDYDTAQILRAWARNPGRIPDSLGQAAHDFVLRRQNPDGSWGPAAASSEYRLADTLASVLSLLDSARSTATSTTLATVHHGLTWLLEDAYRFRPELIPLGMIGWKYLIPALLDDVVDAASAAGLNAIADRLRQVSSPLEPWRAELAAVRAAAAAGHPLPAHLDHVWEIFDRIGAASDAASIHVGCSPAATAAALAAAATPAEGWVHYLTAAMDRHRGAAPTVMPVDIYERAWLLMTLLRAGMPLAQVDRQRLTDTVSSWISVQGASLATGWVPDADDTAAALWVANELGMAIAPTALLKFETDDGFGAFASGMYAASGQPGGERDMSVSVNAHVLEALAAYADSHPEGANLVASGMDKTRFFLLDTQEADGGWGVDKWHSSPVYATGSALLALRCGGSHPATTSAVAAGVDWVLGNQRADGSWGRWRGTLEETAHAVLALAPLARQEDPRAANAIANGREFLRDAWTADPDDPVNTPLWHGKTLHRHRGHDAYPIAALWVADSIAPLNP